MVFTSLGLANKAARALFLAERAPSMWRERSARTSGFYYYVDANAGQPVEPSIPDFSDPAGWERLKKALTEPDTDS